MCWSYTRMLCVGLNGVFRSSMSIDAEEWCSLKDVYLLLVLGSLL